MGLPPFGRQGVEAVHLGILGSGVPLHRPARRLPGKAYRARAGPVRLEFQRLRGLKALKFEQQAACTEMCCWLLACPRSTHRPQHALQASSMPCGKPDLKASAARMLQPTAASLQVPEQAATHLKAL